jgi:hypothetical protein
MAKVDVYWGNRADAPGQILPRPYGLYRRVRATAVAAYTLAGVMELESVWLGPGSLP